MHSSLLSLSWDERTDVVVVGSGFAGLTAAIAAAKTGCSVLVLEKRDFFGGNSWISGGVLSAVYPEMQQKWSIDDSTGRMYDDMIRAGHGASDPALVQLLASRSGDAVRFLKDDLKMTFLDRIDQCGGHSVPRSYTIPSTQGADIVTPLLAQAKDLGVVLCKSAALETLYQDNDGRVCGIRVRHAEEDSSFRRIQARQAVILASGGYSEEVKQPLHLAMGTTLPGTTSEVLQEAQRVGADVLGMGDLQYLPCASPDEEGRGTAPFFASYVVFPYGLMVDPATGDRFVNEWADRKTHADAMLALQQPCIGITDLQAIEVAGEMIQDHIGEGIVQKFNSVEEMAAFYLISTEALKKTLKRYNSFVKDRLDQDFHKPIPIKAKVLKAPYYAIRLWPKAHSTMGGLKINTKTEVLNLKGEAIPGLYAAGEVTGGIHGKARLAGCAITECFVFGRIAGSQASAAKVCLSQSYDVVR